MRLPPFNPRFAVALGIVAVSTTGVFVKLAKTVPATIIANYNLLFAFLFILPIVLIKYREELKNIQPKDWLKLLIASCLLTVHFVLWFEALNYTTVASSALILALQPIAVLLGSIIFFKERYSFGAIISIVITIIGSALMIFGDFETGSKQFFGDLLVLISLVIVSLYELTGQKVRRGLSLITHLFIMYGFGSLFLVVYNVITKTNFTNYSSDKWGVFLLLALIPTFIGLISLNWALRWLKIQTISAGLVVQPILASLLAYLLLDIKVTASQWLGGTIITFGLFLFVMSTFKKTKVTISKTNK